MKHRSLFLALIAAIAISITALIAFTSRASIDGGSKRPPSAEEAEQENPGEAERWEWMRLHDPATGVIPRDIARREGAFARTLPERPESGSSRGGGRSIASLPWIFRGPVNVGGRTRALAIDAADTNVLLAAVNRSSPQHIPARPWLEGALGGGAPVGFAWLALVGFIRISTRPMLLDPPLTVAQATGMVSEWLDRGSARVLHPGERHTELLARLLEHAGTAGNLTNDAHLAALAIEHRATVVTFDTDFERFPGVRTERPR